MTKSGEMQKKLKIKGKMKIHNRRLQNRQLKLKVLSHITKHNCALLPYLNDESLHSLGELLFNVITQGLK